MQTARKVAEFIFIFIGIPLVFYFNLLSVPKIAALLAVSAGCILILWRDDSYTLSHLLRRPAVPGIWKRLCRNTALIAAGVVIITYWVQPNALFVLPREQPIVWGFILVLYPLLSALPQERVYREFLFQRYQSLFKADWLLITVSVLSFAFLHIVYDNVWAIVLTLAGGVMFARTYHQTRSLYWVSIEHALYGTVVFTIGLAPFFYEPF
jgi:membrane protease YdiL (CAAX protease family)